MGNQRLDLVGLDDLRRKFFQSSPKDVEAQINTSTIFYKERMLRKIFELFSFTVPEEWDLDYFRQHLFLDGYVGVTDTALGILALKCAASGYNVFERPTKLIFANPVLGNFDRTIGTDCEVIRLQYNWLGIVPILDKYAYLLAMCDSAVSVNLMNSKVAFIATAEGKAAAETIKTAYQQISEGNPFVCMSKDSVDSISWELLNVKNTFIGNDVSLLKQTIWNEFLTEIGIPNFNRDKRERMITDEVNANNTETAFSMSHWLETIRAGMDRANKMFGLDLRVEVNPILEGGENNGDSSGPSDSGPGNAE